MKPFPTSRFFVFPPCTIGNTDLSGWAGVKEDDGMAIDPGRVDARKAMLELTISPSEAKLRISAAIVKGYLEATEEPLTKGNTTSTPQQEFKAREASVCERKQRACEVSVLTTSGG